MLAMLYRIGICMDGVDTEVIRNDDYGRISIW